MKDLNEYVKSNRKYISINDGESFVGTYQGFSIVPDRFNPGKETVSYMFQPQGSSSMLPWTKASPKIAMQMNKFKVGDVLQITRYGTGTETRYIIQKVEEGLRVETKPGDDIIPF